MCETIDETVTKMDKERSKFHRAIILPSSSVGNPSQVMSTGMQQNSKLSSLLKTDCLIHV